MEHKDLYCLGYISKTRGLKGELVATLDVDDPMAYRKLESVYVEINQQPIPFFITNIHINPKGHANIRFEDVNTEEEAKGFVKASLFLPMDFLPPLTGNKFYYHEIIGFKVIDEAFGEIGPVIEVLDYPGNHLIRCTHNFQDVLVPINDHVVLKVDRDSKSIQVKMPEGLMDIYLGEDDQDQDQ